MILFFLVCYLFDPFKLVGIKDMHNIFYLGLSGEHRCPLGYIVLKLVHPGNNHWIVLPCLGTPIIIHKVDSKAAEETRIH